MVLSVVGKPVTSATGERGGVASVAGTVTDGAARGNLSRQDGTEVYRGDERGEEPSGGGNAQHVRASVGLRSQAQAESCSGGKMQTAPYVFSSEKLVFILS